MTSRVGPVCAAPGPAQAGGGNVQKLGSGLVEQQIRINFLALQRLIRLALACHGALTGSTATRTDGGARFTRGGLQ